KEYDELRAKTLAFTEAFYDSTLPEDVLEAVSANLSILKSPTVLRQPNGRLWAWEGCHDGTGCCSGSCTHVWNYAQAFPNLFPDLERTFRETEFNESQQDDGYQIFRSTLPTSKAARGGHAASDGQLGGIIKMNRDWKISGDTEWLRSMWPNVKKSLEYCINTWDPDHQGIVREPHHNTYDIEFWGPDGMCTSFYLGALKAASEMAEALGESAELYYELYNKGKAYMENELFDGEYFYQKIMWRELEAGKPENFQKTFEYYSPEAKEILEKEGPKYQYGKGCISDGVIGCWMAECAGLGEIVDNNKVKSHLKAVHKYNLKSDLSKHVNPQRPSYAFGSDGGLLLCTWPKGEKLSLPFIYSNEVWTGIEYQVAAHCIMLGLIDEGLDIVRTCRARYDGTIRNPFNEYECGHWYARALSSYSLLQAFSGAFYNAVEKTLYLKPRIKGDFRSFISTATGFGTVGVKDGKPFIEVKYGKIDVEKVEYTPFS
ncbi:MAG: GH116 family glycosyl hydrolase, partial [Armatimonadota bacterium]